MGLGWKGGRVGFGWYKYDKWEDELGKNMHLAKLSNQGCLADNDV